MTLPTIVAGIFGAGLLLNAFIFVPQAIRIYRTRSAQGVSLATFLSFNAMQFIGSLHGYFQNDMSLMIGMLGSLLTSGTVTALALIFRERQPA